MDYRFIAWKEDWLKRILNWISVFINLESFESCFSFWLVSITPKLPAHQVSVFYFYYSIFKWNTNWACATSAVHSFVTHTPNLPYFSRQKFIASRKNSKMFHKIAMQKKLLVANKMTYVLMILSAIVLSVKWNEKNRINWVSYRKDRQFISNNTKLIFPS